MDINSIDLSKFVLAGIPILALVPFVVQLIKELGVPSPYLPASSVAVAAMLISVALFAPMSVALVVGGSIAIGGASTAAVRYIKNGPSSNGS
jgi:membrane associated rhomboid family serine protease